MIENIYQAFLMFGRVEILLMLVSGVAIGAVFSAIPGLTSTLALALILPFTYDMPPIPAFVFMMGLFGGGMYGGALTAITLKIPGAPGSVATTFDGFPMFQKGEGGRAIGTATFCSMVGGMGSAVILTLTAGQIAEVAVRFGPPEMFALTVFGLIAVITIGDDLIKGSLAGLFGLLLGATGIDIFGNLRLDFGISALIGGTPLLPTVVGLFAIVKMFQSINEAMPAATRARQGASGSVEIGRMRFPSWAEIRRLTPLLTRSLFLGTFIGVLPGAGGNIAAFTAYNLEKRISKRPEEFGTGVIDGIAAPETANNSVIGGDLIPTLTLGIPGSQFTAVLLGAFLIHGLPVGPLLFRDHQEIIYVVFMSVFLLNLLFIPIGFLASKYLIRLANVRDSIIITLISAFSFAGLYAISATPTNLWIAFVIGTAAFFFARYDIPVGPIVLGLILSSIIEDSLTQSLIMSSGSPLIFLTRPVSLMFMVLTVLFVMFPYIRRTFARRREAANPDRA